jgi:hypothetical protein
VSWPGGHTLDDKEPKYGLSVMGFVHPGRVATKAGAKPGDVLILIKPLGIGIITTALKGQVADSAHVEAAKERDGKGAIPFPFFLPWRAKDGIIWSRETLPLSCTRW